MGNESPFLYSIVMQDLRLAESVSQPIPVAAAANEIYKQAKCEGLGDLDFSAVIETIKPEQQ